MRRDYFGPEVLALQAGRPLPSESLVARFNPFLDDGFLCVGGRLQGDRIQAYSGHWYRFHRANLQQWDTPFETVLHRTVHLRHQSRRTLRNLQ